MVAPLDQTLPEFWTVIDLPVADQHKRLVLVEHRLMTVLKINNAEPSLGERDRSRMMVPLIIRSSVMKSGSSHRTDPLALSGVGA